MRKSDVIAKERQSIPILLLKKKIMVDTKKNPYVILILETYSTLKFIDEKKKCYK